MSEHIFKSHNKILLLYHLVFPSKYRRKIFTKEIEKSLIEICVDIEMRYEINFIEIGNDEDHMVSLELFIFNFYFIIYKTK